MTEQITAEVASETPPEVEEAPEAPVEAPTQIEEEPAAETPAEDPSDPGPVPAEEPPLPEVEATVGHDQVTGKYLVSITTRHPDPTVVAVNGRAVWEG